MCIRDRVKGAFDGLTGKCSDFSFEDAGILKPSSEKAPQSAGASRTDIDTADIRFGYCTEFIIKLEKEYSQKDEDELKKYLGSIGAVSYTHLDVYKRQALSRP